MKPKTALIIGGGFAGCAAAHQLSLRGGWDITLVEANAYLGAGVYTHFHGGHPYTFGPRHFMTDNEVVYQYLNKHIPLRHLSHKFFTFIEQDNDFYHFPIHIDDIDRMPDADKIRTELSQTNNAKSVSNLKEYWMNSIGPTLYSKFIDKYNKKMWQIDDNTLLDTFEWSQKNTLSVERDKPDAADKLPDSPIQQGTKYAYEDLFSGYPIASNGYNDYFGLATAEATVYLSTRIEQYDIPNRTVVIKGQKIQYDVIISTISPDILFDFSHGELPYIGRDFHKIVLPIEFCLPEDVFFIYYANDEKFTRLVEYKKLTHHNSSSTLIGLEIPSKNGKHYPLPIKSAIAQAGQYFAEMPDGVFSIGRAGCYDYNVHIPPCIEQAMSVADKVS